MNRQRSDTPAYCSWLCVPAVESCTLIIISSLNRKSSFLNPFSPSGDVDGDRGRNLKTQLSSCDSESLLMQAVDVRWTEKNMLTRKAANHNILSHHSKINHSTIRYGYVVAVSGMACFAINRLICHSNLWKRID